MGNNDTAADDKRGTFWDWPTGWILAGVVLLVIAVVNGATGGMLVGLVVAGIGGLATAIRRGAFTPGGK